MHSRLKSHSSIHDLCSFVEEGSNDCESQLKDVDLVVSCGGDGTLLHISSIFQKNPCPPVLPFSLGSLGFLSTFDFHDHKTVLPRLLHGKLPVFNRTRLLVESNALNADHGGQQIILNEVLLNRGMRKDVPEFEFRFDDDFYFPSAIADGILISTATGSSGHSLSAGGPLLHPELDSILVNMLAPRTLSFRPLILPASTSKALQVAFSPSSKSSSADIHLDGKIVTKINKNDTIKVSKSANPMPVFSLFGSSADWNYRLSRTIFWNQPFKNTSSQ